MSAVLIEHFDLLAASLGSVAKLRELILSLAVRGKLVPQDPTDEPASELLKKIRAEKDRLIAEGKIKRDKSLPVISEDEAPYELPDSWIWIRLPDAYYSISPSSNKLLSSLIADEGQFPVVDQGKTFIAGYTNDAELLIHLPGPVIVFGDHTKERKYVDFDFVAGADGTKILRPVLQNERYFYWYVRSLHLEGRGYARHFKVLNDNLYALPPLAEQSRIVTKVEALMALCDRLEAEQGHAARVQGHWVEAALDQLAESADANEFHRHWQHLAKHFDTLFTTPESIDRLDATLLQLAVRGKLVPQDPTDEPASELLKQIRTEKDRLIAEGKIKRDKPLLPITDDEKPYELPEGWEWLRLADMLPEFQNGASSRGDDGGAATVVLRLADIKSRRISLAETRTIPIDQRDVRKYGLAKGDVLVVRVNGSADIVGQFIPVETEVGAIYCDHFIRMRINPERCQASYLCLLGQTNLIRDKISGLFITTAGQKTVNQGHISSLLVALPPLTEQSRIVAQVEKLRALTASLKARLATAQTKQTHLAEALIDEVLA